jgi:hypothetical protein
MEERKTLTEFKKKGLLLLVNQVLHCFGYSLVFIYDDELKEYVGTKIVETNVFGFNPEDKEIKKILNNFKKL